MTAPARKIRIILAWCAVASLAVAASLFYFGYIRFNYPGSARFPVRGLDVSHHQGHIQWEKVKKTAAFTFVFIKATEGGDFVDPEFRYNWENARKNGFAVGAYHFFTFRKSGKEQANNFINTVPDEDNSLPPVVDCEFMGNSRNKLSKQELYKELSDFIRIIERRYRKKPVLYSTYEFYDHYLAGRFREYPLWIRDVFREPGLIDGRRWTFWQYANRARIGGIGSYVDMNVFNGNEEAFSVFFKRRNLCEGLR